MTDRWPVFRTFGDCGGNLFESSRRCQWSLYASGGWTSSCVRCEASFLPAKSPVSSYRVCTIAMAAFRFAPHTIKYLPLRRRSGPEVMEDALRGRTNACRGSCKLQEAELQINSHPPQYRKGSLRWSLSNTIWNQNPNLHVWDFSKLRYPIGAPGSRVSACLLHEMSAKHALHFLCTTFGSSMLGLQLYQVSLMLDPKSPCPGTYLIL